MSYKEENTRQCRSDISLDDSLRIDVSPPIRRPRVDLGGFHSYKIDTRADFIAQPNQRISLILNGRGERIRTSDPLVPNQVRYQTALRPEIVW